ncbi:RNA 2',3'-cyclic phosphodiesterase [Pseudomonas sp. Marseille-QA0332]
METREAGQPFKRLFFALDCPEPQRRAIAQWRRELGLRSGKPVAAENFHLTLLFLGDVDTVRLADICTAVDELAKPSMPVRLSLDRLQAWQRARVLVLEPGQTPPVLRRLVYDLQQTLLPLGFQEQSREYRPHLTLARDFHGQAPEATSAPAFHLNARGFALYESRKGRYWPLAHWTMAEQLPDTHTGRPW